MIPRIFHFLNASQIPVLIFEALHQLHYFDVPEVVVPVELGLGVEPDVPELDVPDPDVAPAAPELEVPAPLELEPGIEPLVPEVPEPDVPGVVEPGVEPGVSAPGVLGVAPVVPELDVAAAPDAPEPAVSVPVVPELDAPEPVVPELGVLGLGVLGVAALGTDVEEPVVPEVDVPAPLVDEPAPLSSAERLQPANMMLNNPAARTTLVAFTIGFIIIPFTKNSTQCLDCGVLN